MSFPVCSIGDHARNERDVHACSKCPHDVRGPATEGSPTVHVNGKAVLRRCDKGVHSSCCGSQEWEAVQGSATVLVDGRPVVRLNDTTRHCGGLGKMIEASSDILIGGPSVCGRPIQNVLSYMYKEMTQNATGPDSDYINDNLDRTQWDSLIPFKADVDNAQAYKKWYELVKTGGDWDHKGHIVKHYGKWAYDQILDRSFSFETWSNIHYGYVGRASGFDPWILRAGAGVAQYLDGHSPPGYWERRLNRFGDADVLAALDEAEDQAAINIGIELWEQYGTDFTEKDLLMAIQDAASDLKTLPGVAC